MDRLKVSRELASRYLNDGFSGGEKKRVEILQMAMLKPRIAVLDETDSGLDIDALKVVAGGVKELVGPNMGALVITHYKRILELHRAGPRPRLRRRAGSSSPEGRNSRISWKSSATRSGAPRTAPTPTEGA